MWVTIYNTSFVNLVLESLGDACKRQILNSVLTESQTIPDIIEIHKLPQTTAYRKVNELIQSRLLVSQRSIQRRNSDKTNVKCIFDGVRIEFEKNKTVVKALIKKEFLKNYKLIEKF